MALGDNKVLGFFGPGGGAKMSIGTCELTPSNSSVVQTRLTYVEVAFLTPSTTGSVNDFPTSAASLNTTYGRGSFLAAGHAGDNLNWLAIGK
jgi:hypothetical protein